jgi:3-deoxy-D-arabino-heptulosonate 7-phosphate (DAHP) synthase
MERTLLPTQAFVTRQFCSSGKPVGKPNQSEEILEVHQFAVEPASVKVEMGMTINLGNYESAKITVALIQPCYSEEKDAAYDYAKRWVEERTLKEAEEARKFAQGRSNPF